MIKDDPTIGLYGIDGTYNYGCEAIVRGTEKILREIWPDVTIKYISLRPEDDKKRLKGCNVEIIPRTLHPLWSLQRINGISAYHTGLYWKNYYREDLKWVDDCDLILSIGGDLYTLATNYKDPKLKPYYNSLIHFGDIIKNKNKKFVVWGASIGPFKGKAKNSFAKHLKNVDLITSREPKSTEYLKSINIHENVVECADPAFKLNLDKRKTSTRDKLKVGINLSPLSYSHNLEQLKSSNIYKQAKMIKKIIEYFEAEIVLIPHVFCDFNLLDDDLRHLSEVKDALPDDINDDVKLIDKDNGFMYIKKILAECDIVIASRMHCAINALEVNIPTIFLSYSSKAKGMAKYVYGNEELALSYYDTDLNTLLKLIENIVQTKENNKNFLKEKIEKIKLDTLSF